MAVYYQLQPSPLDCMPNLINTGTSNDIQGSHGREKGRELFFLFPTLKRSGRMIFFNKVVKRSGKMKSANGNFPKVQITRKFGIDLLQ